MRDDFCEQCGKDVLPPSTLQMLPWGIGQALGHADCRMVCGACMTCLASVALLSAARHAIAAEYADCQLSPELLANAVRLPKDDTGEWCGEHGRLVVYREYGLPDLYRTEALDEWLRIGESLQAAGFPVYAEFMNPAVVVFYDLP